MSEQNLGHAHLINFDYEQIGCNLFPQYEIQGIAGRVVAYHLARLLKMIPQPEPSPDRRVHATIIQYIAIQYSIHLFTVAHKAVGAHASDIAILDSCKVVPGNSVVGAWPSVKELETEGPDKNSIRNNPIEIFFSDGSRITISHEEGLMRGTLVPPNAAARRKIAHAKTSRLSQPRL